MMFEILFPHDDAMVASTFPASGLLGSPPPVFSARVVLVKPANIPESPSHTIYGAHVKTSGNTWMIVFHGLKPNHKYDLELFDLSGAVFERRRNLTVKEPTFGATIDYPLDTNSPVGTTFPANGATDPMKPNGPLNCCALYNADDEKVMDGEIGFVEFGFWGAMFEDVEPGSYTLKVGHESCSLPDDSSSFCVEDS